jgi:tetratricopeptide (TPR) repeat protein
MAACQVKQASREKVFLVSFVIFCLVASTSQNTIAPRLKIKYVLAVIGVLAGNVIQIEADEAFARRNYVGLDYPHIASILNQGSEAAGKGDYEKARQYYTVGISQDPKAWPLYFNRAFALMHLRKPDLAIQDLNSVLRLARGILMVQVVRGQIYEDIGKYSLALADYERVASITVASLPLTSAFALNSRAWLRATCPDASFRNGKQALADAKSACNQASWTEDAYIDTLAAAHAEAGDFDSAIQFEQRAIKRAHEEAWAIKDPKQRQDYYEHQLARYQRRLAAYQRHQPWRSNLD